MSLSRELPSTLDVQQYEAEPLNQRLSQPGLAYWLTSESPIARTFSTGNVSQQHRPSFTYLEPAPAMESSVQQSQDFNFEEMHAEPMVHGLPTHVPPPNLHLSDLENGPTDVPLGLPWPSAYDQELLFSKPFPYAPLQSFPAYMRSDYGEAQYSEGAASPYSSTSLYDESPLQSPCLSSPGLCTPRYASRPPRSSPNDDLEMDEDDDATDGKPYARLIYEALRQAPGNRMMLREIYEWFEQNTSKPRESAGHGWQNSIRHNLSINKAFENDKTECTNARGETKKATSVWFLTRDALLNGVQSTTRYRKKDQVKKAPLSGNPDCRRQKSGAKGGRAARRAARLRRLEQSHHGWALETISFGTMDNLVRAANYLNDHHGHHDSSPPTPTESLPYTPRSPLARLESVLCGDGGGGGGGKTPLAGADANTEDFHGEDCPLPHYFEGRGDATW